ncbi:hypothetical protein SAMN04488559_1071, partial [Isobaculum melis]
MKKLKKKRSLVGVLLLLICGTYLLRQEGLERSVSASAVVTAGDFRLNVNNKWDAVEKKSYASLKWDAVPDLSLGGYQLYQSEDGVTWNARSLKYGKAIKVLNIYPDWPASNTLASWMN